MNYTPIQPLTDSSNSQLTSVPTIQDAFPGDLTIFSSWLAEQHPGIKTQSAFVVLELAHAGATVPFIARYRKERTGNLDEVAIGQVIDAFERWKTLIERKQFILREIEDQGKLTPALHASIQSTYELNVLEDLYLPYKRKRKTKAAVAREAGLLPLADWIWDAGHGSTDAELVPLDEMAGRFISSETGISDIKSAVEGAEAILIERLAEVMELRQEVRSLLLAQGKIQVSKTEQTKPHSKFEKYFDYVEPIHSLLIGGNSHRYLAIRRGQAEGELTISIGSAPCNSELMASLLSKYEQHAITVKGSPGERSLSIAARLAFKVHVTISIENELHAMLREKADAAAIEVFSENVRKVLLAAPLGSKCVLGVDPGLRTGCKLALISAAGDFVASGVIHLLTPDQQKQSFEQIKSVLASGKVDAIAVGNGTAARETEKFLRECVSKLERTIPIVMVSESGASIYSASETAREEFPDLDVTVRGAISIARRLQDPLAELVKVDPKSIGVGQYQHDVSQSALKTALERVVESCVNNVGVNVNTASRHLLSFVSGIGPSLARAIVEYRSSHGLFRSRESLREVPRFGDRVFEQAAGFLRVSGGANPLDNTGIHPERYPILEKYVQAHGNTLQDLIGAGACLLKADTDLRKDLGDFTLDDIVKELEKPGRDPRSKFELLHFREDIHEISDLKLGMICTGVVTNVTNFGAFVDIGVHQDGLVHISQLSDSFIKDPRTVVNPGDKVQVRVIEIVAEKKQIALSMRKDSTTEGQNRGKPTRPNSPIQNSNRQSTPSRSHSEPIGNNPFAQLGNMLTRGHK